MYKLSSKKSVLLILITIILGAILCPSILFSRSDKAHALSYNNYYFTKYDVKIEVTDKNVFSVEENFVVKYGNPEYGLHKGIVRAIPLNTFIEKEVGGKEFSRTYKLKSSNVSANELYDHYIKENWLYIELGGDEYINQSESGFKNYTVKYTLDMGDDYNDDYDFFFYNIIGDDYPVEINNITFSITLPYDFEGTPAFYKGVHASKETPNVGYKKTVLEDGRVLLTGTYSLLRENEAISIDLTLKEGYFEGLKNVVSKRKTLDGIVIAFACFIILSIVVVTIVFYNKKKRPVETVEFYPPLDMTPVDAGYLLKGKVTPQDMMSLIVYWASKGIVKIELDSNKDPIRVKKLQDITEQVPDYEKAIFKEMFQYVDTYSLKGSDASMAGVVNKSKTDVVAHNGELWSSRSKKIRIALGFACFMPLLFAIIVEAPRVAFFSDYLMSQIFSLFMIGIWCFLLPEMTKENWKVFIIPCIGMAAIDVAFIFSGFLTMFVPLWSVLIRIAPIIIFLFTNRLFREYNDSVIEKVGILRGFKKNLILVEEKKLKELVDEDPEYFYHILPYAYTMDITKDFIEKFENIAVYPNDNFGDIVTISYMVRLRATTRRIMPSSSGGFGGSGGGGGGAGGGAGGGGSSGR